MSAGGICSGVALLAAGAALLAGWRRPSWAPAAAGAAALAAALAMAVAGILGSERILDVPWVPVLGSRLTLRLDALALPLALFTTALAAPILFYTGSYLPERLAKHGRDVREQARFSRLMLGFMGAMVLLLVAQDLLVMFAALELTALASFLLIEFDRKSPGARRAASTALIVTAGSSLFFLLGVLLIQADAGTTSLAALREAAPGREPSTLAAACLAVGALAKSAQVPLHFWLPRAMVAPVPVSAYLHSATLVAAGVFVLARLRFLLEDATGVLLALQWIGFASIFAGGVMALASDGMKRILAYSTIAQHGYAVLLIALGGKDGLAGAPLFIVAHGIPKCALFLTAGAVTSATGADRLSETGGLLARMPLLGAASAVAALAIAGLPGTVGYFKDELLFAATSAEGALPAVLASLAAALTVAYSARFWLGIFAGSGGRGAPRPARGLTVPVTVLAAFAVLGGVWTQPLAHAVSSAAEVASPLAAPVELAYHFDLRPELWMATGAWAGGVVLVAARRSWQPFLESAVRWASRYAGPARLADGAARAACALSHRLHRMELRELRERIMAVLVPTALLVVLGAFAGGAFKPSFGAMAWKDVPVATALLATAGASVAALWPRRYIALILLLSAADFGLALTFALAGAPDLALVVVVIQTVLTILFLAVLSQLRSRPLSHARSLAEERPRVPWPGIAAGVAVLFLAWSALEGERRETVAWEHVRLAERAHAKDVVTAILADFRALDTAGEITVLAVAVLGAASIKWGRMR